VKLADSSTLCTAYAQSDCRVAAVAAAWQHPNSGWTKQCTGNTQTSRRKLFGRPCTVKQKWRRRAQLADALSFCTAYAQSDHTGDPTDPAGAAQGGREKNTRTHDTKWEQAARHGDHLARGLAARVAAGMVRSETSSCLARPSRCRELPPNMPLAASCNHCSGTVTR
jgi:hypothetical protein